MINSVKAEVLLNIELILILSGNKNKSITKPKIPVAIVVMNWAKLPVPVAKAPYVRFPLSRNNIRPPISPILFGVKMPIVIPEKTALKALMNVKYWTLSIKTFHLIVSMPQFKNINKKTDRNNNKSEDE